MWLTTGHESRKGNMQKWHQKWLSKSGCCSYLQKKVNCTRGSPLWTWHSTYHRPCHEKTIKSVSGEMRWKRRLRTSPHSNVAMDSSHFSPMCVLSPMFSRLGYKNEATLVPWSIEKSGWISRTECSPTKVVHSAPYGGVLKYCYPKAVSFPITTKVG